MILGIDFGHYSIKIVVINNKEIYSVGEKTIINNLSGFDPDKLEVSHWQSAFKELCDELNINIKKVDKIISSISGSKVSIKPLTMLEMEESELIEILNFEAKKHVPLDGSDPVVDYHILGQNPKEIDKLDMLLVATTQKIIKNHNLIIKSCSLKHPVFDTDPIALLNCYQYNYECIDNHVDVLLNIGLLNTTILVYGDNQELLTREISIGGHQINLDIMKLKGSDYSEAENSKKVEGVSIFESDNDSESNSIQISQRNVLSDLSDEIRKTLRYYMKSKTGLSYNKFYISGGSSSMPGVVDFLNSNLNVEFEQLNPFNKLEMKDSIDNASKYAVSFGLAIREMDKD
tara:strand:- start:2388 stop:3422 length:1035 start_codon:yes stop_codon:yes gene_type:complete